MATTNSAAILRPRVTWYEYQQLPDDGMRYEVLEGELVVTPAPEYQHQLVSKNIEYAMETWRRARGGGGQVLHAPFDVILALDTIVQPDIVYMSAVTLKQVARGRLQGPPDVVVEIFNERGAARDRVTKLQVYAKFQVKEYWLVDLESRSLTVLGLVEGGYQTLASGAGDATVASSVMEGFAVSPREAFDGC